LGVEHQEKYKGKGKERILSHAQSESLTRSPDSMRRSLGRTEEASSIALSASFVSIDVNPFATKEEMAKAVADRIAQIDSQEKEKQLHRMNSEPLHASGSTKSLKKNKNGSTDSSVLLKAHSKVASGRMQQRREKRKEPSGLFMARKVKSKSSLMKEQNKVLNEELKQAQAEKESAEKKLQDVLNEAYKPDSLPQLKQVALKHEMKHVDSQNKLLQQEISGLKEVYAKSNRDLDAAVAYQEDRANRAQIQADHLQKLAEEDGEDEDIGTENSTCEVESLRENNVGLSETHEQENEFNLASDTDD
jgi:hypothetical protein